MRRASLCGLCTVFLFAAASQAQAVVSLSFDCSHNPTALLHNQSVTFQVKVTGLEEVDSPALDSLGVTVAYTGGLLSAPPPDIIKGTIVPSLGEWFTDTDADPPQADASYDAMTSGARIQSDGDFYQFTVQTADMNGNGQLWFTTAYATKPDPDTPGYSVGVPLDSAIMNFSIVPEPSSFVLLTMAALAAGAYLLKRRMYS